MSPPPRSQRLLDAIATALDLDPAVFLVPGEGAAIAAVGGAGSPRRLMRAFRRLPDDASRLRAVEIVEGLAARPARSRRDG